jgi:arylsulfatase A-like enzyme
MNTAFGASGKHRWRVVWLLAVALCLSCQKKEEPPAKPAARNVVFVLVDALRADHLGCYGYERETSPHLDALAADGTRFENAVSPAPWTLPTMGTIWTSLYPCVHGATKPSDLAQWMRDKKTFRPASSLHESRTTLAEVLSGAGFSTVAYVDGSYPGRVFGFAQGFDRFVEDQLRGIRLNAEALFYWLDRKRPEHFFVYLHVVEVHSPYSPPKVPLQFRGRKSAHARRVQRVLARERERYADFDFDPDYEGPADGSWDYLGKLRAGDGTRRDLEHVVALYDRGIAYTDFWIGKLVAGLKKRGLYDDTVIIVTSDHGDEFFDHGRLEHGTSYYEEMMRVPLIVRVPGEGQGKVIRQQVGLIDIMPTVLDLVGVRHSLDLQGVSLRPLLDGAGAPERLMFAEASMVPALDAAVRTNHWKYIHWAGQRRQELYDLEADPRERHNLCAERLEPCAPWAREVQRWREEMKQTKARLALPPPEPAVIDERTRERLRALGYEE